MAIHRNNYFLACMGSDRLDRVMSTFYSGDSTLDYEEEASDIWFITSSRHDRIGYMMSILLNHFCQFQSLRFLERLFGEPGDYNFDFKEYTRVMEFDIAGMSEVIKDISLFFDAVLSTDIIIFEGIEGYSLDANYIEKLIASVIGKEVNKTDLDSDCHSFGDLFTLLKLIQQLFQKSVKDGMNIGYMSNSAG